MKEIKKPAIKEILPKVKCPICKGKGLLPKPTAGKWGKSVTKRVMCRLLRKEGYTYRAIMRFLNLKSPRSVAQYLYPSKIKKETK